MIWIHRQRFKDQVLAFLFKFGDISELLCVCVPVEKFYNIF